jgi:hypothetical protein
MKPQQRFIALALATVSGVCLWLGLVGCATPPRPEPEIHADIVRLGNEISAYMEQHMGHYSGPGIWEAVMKARPDLKRRSDKLMKEARRAGME